MILGSILGPWRGTLGVILEPGSQIGGDYVDFLVIFSGLGKGAKTELPRGGGHAIRLRRRMFREGRPSSLRLHFGPHFGVILGAKFATILFFVALVAKTGSQKRD